MFGSLGVPQGDPGGNEAEQPQHRLGRFRPAGPGPALHGLEQPGVPAHVFRGLVRAVTPEDHVGSEGWRAGRAAQRRPSQLSSRNWKRPIRSEMRDITVYP